MASEVGENEASAVTESAAEQAAKLRAVAAELRAQVSLLCAALGAVSLIVLCCSVLY